MQHPLPIKPSFLGQSSLTPTPLYPTSLPTLPLPNQNAIASSFKTTLSTTSLKSSPSLKECSICSQPPKYTCPRCSLKTCSLSCTKTHKAEYSCSGTRDPTSFVTLKEFKQGDWGDDFRWLEDGRRKLCAWGEGIKEGEVDLVTGMKRGGGKDQRGGGGRLGGKDTRNGNGNDKKGKGRSKSEILQMELRRRGVWMCLMPDGMGKKKLNQSGWNPKSKAIHLSIQITVTISILEIIDSKLLKSTETDKIAGVQRIHHPRILFSHPSDPIPNLRSLLPQSPSPESPEFPEGLISDIVFLLPFVETPIHHLPYSTLSAGIIINQDQDQTACVGSPVTKKRAYFPPLDGDVSIDKALRGTSWVEFPEIHIMKKTKWDNGLKNGDYLIVDLAEPRQAQSNSSGIGDGVGRGTARAGTGSNNAVLGKRKMNEVVDMDNPSDSTQPIGKEVKVDQSFEIASPSGSGLDQKRVVHGHSLGPGLMGVLGDYDSEDEEDVDDCDDDNGCDMDPKDGIEPDC